MHLSRSKGNRATKKMLKKKSRLYTLNVKVTLKKASLFLFTCGILEHNMPDTMQSQTNKNGPTPPRNKMTFSQRSADHLTSFMGSWTFILFFCAFLVVWMAINAVAWTNSWDPYPFILLNLVLSTLAATQAPIIMMSQNRQAERDRQQAQYDYAVNRKAEREIQDMQKELQSIKRVLKKIDKDKQVDRNDYVVDKKTVRQLEDVLKELGSLKRLVKKTQDGKK